jgi:hypothetical protein
MIVAPVAESAARFRRGYVDSGSRYDWACRQNKMISAEYPTFDALSVVDPDAQVAFLDRRDIDEGALTPEQLHWRRHGYVILEKFIPDRVIDGYLELRKSLKLGNKPFPTRTPYCQYPIIRDLFCDPRLDRLLVDLVGEAVGMHATLTEFHSPERGWHQDDYLNPPTTMGRFAAVWAAVGDVPETSGPFEFIPASHLWKVVDRGLVRSHLHETVRADADPTGGPTWDIYAEQFVTPAYHFEILRVGTPIKRFLARRGDLLIRHARLVHRDSLQQDPGAARPGIVAHYSSVGSARWSGAAARRHGDGGYYWPFD